MKAFSLAGGILQVLHDLSRKVVPVRDGLVYWKSPQREKTAMITVQEPILLPSELGKEKEKKKTSQKKTKTPPGKKWG